MLPLSLAVPADRPCRSAREEGFRSARPGRKAAAIAQRAPDALHKGRLKTKWPCPREQGHLVFARVDLECVRLAAAFLAGGSYGQRRARRTRPSPPEGSEGGPGRGWPLTSPLVSVRESEESGGKPHALLSNSWPVQARTSWQARVSRSMGRPLGDRGLQIGPGDNEMTLPVGRLGKGKPACRCNQD